MTFWLVFSFHLWMFFSCFFPPTPFGWIILHSFQGHKPIAGTYFPDYLIFPPYHKQHLLSFFTRNSLVIPSHTHCHAPWAGWWGCSCREQCSDWVMVKRSPISLHSLCGKAFWFSVLLFFCKLKDSSGSPAFYFWLLLFTKEQGQTWTSRPLCLGVVIFGGACLAWNDFGSNVHLIFRKHKSHANHAHPVDVYIQRPPFFHNVQKKGNESQNTTSMSWTDCKSLPILDQRNFWLWVLDPSELVATFPLTPVALHLSLGRLSC